MNKIVIITGAIGFIGQNIAKEFKQNNYYVIGIGHGFVSPVRLKSMGIDEWYESDLSMVALLKITKRPDLIVHSAGGSTVGKSIDNPYLDYHKTVNSTLELLEYIRLHTPTTPIIYLSSAAIYGAKEDIIIHEQDNPNPVSPYGFHKLASESICKSYSQCFGIKVAIVRLFSIYGEGLTKQLLWDACNKIINADKDVLFYGTGHETRDWLHVKDVASLVRHLASTEFSFLVLNGGCSNKTTVKDILELLVLELDRKDVKIVFNGLVKEGDPKFYHAGIEEALNIGWRPTLPIETGIKNYVKWFKNYL
ncbi:NAD-dependent epimerase/dehydratase family protein [Dyadobacter frigoris]|uniref:SDR family oxidoreductase n=1 Tax=Dyadobacter frigoris TaxID=2576211 RepID=A0A4U6CWR6_9BACT|nr:SDR family oxidoreductase [Dyadobacter frigoris]TKT87648.1 SDR family oxidoreductase [Dyadobacter frigoris]